MNLQKTSFWVIFMILFLTACSPTLSPFTQRLYDQNRWNDNELRQIQFYLSDDVVLRRELSGGSAEIVTGKIKVVDGRRIEEVTFRRGTPGILLFRPKGNRFAISFEDGSDQRFLMFGPNPKLDDRYVLLASEWKKKRGIVTYEGKKYSVHANDALANLVVDLKKVREVSVRSRTAKGRMVD
ncbi:MAG: hypothetical protein GY705_04450 [Bacteroidetes bacterium]|nr:hypothetical protein [Bacteroidota bacterium]